MTLSKSVGFPPQIKYIVGNEACERFSYYGMRCILVIFMTKHLLMSAENAQATYHLFMSACYLLPLFGAYLSDRFLGKYKTIIFLSLIYCLGHLTLAIHESPGFLYAGLTLIALGAGGIKPCVSAHVGDQFTDKNKHLLGRVFDIFYWSINFGAFFSTLLIPIILAKYGPSWAFGIPGILMALATMVFGMGRGYYVHVPPTGKTGVAGFMPVVWYSFTHWGQKKAGQSFLDIARARFSSEEVEAAKAAASIFKVFITVAMFWALFDQSGSSWVLQAEKMDLVVWGRTLDPSQIQALNPIMVMVLIPLFTYFLYPMVEKMGVQVTPLRKMSAGMILAALSFVFVGMIQTALDSGQPVSVAWQFIPFLVLTCAEVMVSITGLEFAYTQAPRSMKSTIMSFWLLTVFAGNLLTAIVAKVNYFQGAMFFYFFAILMFFVGLIFVFFAAKYRVRNFLEKSAVGASGVMAPSAG